MTEEYDDAITEWYMKARHTDPLDYICTQRVLNSNQTGKNILILNTKISPCEILKKIAMFKMISNFV